MKRTTDESSKRNTPGQGKLDAPRHDLDPRQAGLPGAGDLLTGPESPRFPVVGLGASAGGLEALRQLFAHIPTDSGMAFVVIQHLDPDRPSMLTKVLEGITHMPVVEAVSGMRVEPDRVHVIPSGSDLRIEHGLLRLVPRQKTGRLHLPIDSFFRSLSEDGRDRAIAVVLSGSGKDGTEGLRAIKAEGGIAIAQAPDSAQFRDMPESAIAAGLVDFLGTPEAIAGELGRLSRHPYVVGTRRLEGERPEAEIDEDAALTLVFTALRRHAGVDFSGYKRTTVLRRIDRRMALRREGSLGEYASALQDDFAEARALAQDMLIHVTSFFRDPESFAALKGHVFPELARRNREGGSIRIWVPGCSSGEEAYAITISLLESLDDTADSSSVKVFGSDLSDEAIETARAGVYSESAMADVAPERLSRFFERVEGGFRIAKRVRDLCVFVKHDLTRDPPFAKLDLISCRNVLIYFDAELQRRIVPLLHYCLSRGGVLFLGSSETIAGFPDLFAPVDREHRIFVKTGDSPRLIYPLPAGREAEAQLSEYTPPERRHPAREAQRQADHLLLARYAPAGVIVNDRLEVIQFRGRTGAYLEPPPGQPQANILRMTREGLAAHLHDALERAKAETATVRKERLRIQDGAGGARFMDLEVTPLASMPDSTERYFLVLFEEAGTKASEESGRPVELGPSAEGLGAEVERVHAELSATRDYVQTLISEHQDTADDLAAANEELQSTNEELQSTNEELQSAKEELQSTNEELSTVNDQLRNRNQELDQVAGDLVNVLSSVEIPVIIVDLDQRVRRFTPTAAKIASFIPGDVGRRIDDLKLKVHVDDLGRRIKEVVESLAPKEWEVQGYDGRWFRMQVRPYRTVDNRLDGAVLSFVDVDALKSALTDAEAARDYARSIVETVTVPLVVLDAGLRVVSANEAFHRQFGVLAKAGEGRNLLDLAPDVWSQPALRRALDLTLTEGSSFTALELTTETPRVGRKVLSLSGRPLLWAEGEPMVLLAIDDVTNLRALEAERVELLKSEKFARLEAERANRAKDFFLATLFHELRTPLSTILMSAQLLRHLTAGHETMDRASASIERAAAAQARLIEDLLDVSRIASGKLLLDLGPVDLKRVVEDAVDIARPSAQAKDLYLKLDVEGEVGSVYGDPNRLQQVVNNLLTNSIKFTPHGGRVSVHLEKNEGRAHLTVTDTGVGIRPEVLPHLFGRFVQADSSVTRTHGGLGLGLSIVRHLVEAHGGEVHAESPGEGMGSTFRVILPVGDAVSGSPTREPAVVAARIEGLRILLVEDDHDVREAYAMVLTQFGAEVRTAPSAAAGLAIMEGFLPSAILCDISMPVEDGYSFIRKVRKLAPARGGQVPAAAVTALANEAERQRALRAGFQMHVPKPVDSVTLAEVVRKLADWGPLDGEPPPRDGG